MIIHGDRSFDWGKLVEFVKVTHEPENSGHDFSHIERTLGLGSEIADTLENIDYDVLSASCLLHDIAFPAYGPKGHNIKGAEIAQKILSDLNFNKEKIPRVCESIFYHASRKPDIKLENLPMEYRILIEADNLDALGSIGIIRATKFCSKHNIPIYKNGDSDGFDDSLYGTLKIITTWDKTILTKKGRELMQPRKEIIRTFLDRLKQEYANKR